MECVASSSDGTKLVAGGYARGDDVMARIKISTDLGATWIIAFALPVDKWGCVVSSADGTKLFAHSSNCKVYASTNSGSTWNMLSDARSRWDGNPEMGGSLRMALSSDGTELFSDGHYKAMTNTNSLFTYISNMNPPNWTELGLRFELHDVASSSDGTKLVVVGGGPSGPALTSSDSGKIWRVSSSKIGDNIWLNVASSADGMRLVATKYGATMDTIYVSADSGVTWQRFGTKDSWGTIAISADGSTIIVCNNYNSKAPTRTTVVYT